MNKKYRIIWLIPIPIFAIVNAAIAFVLTVKYNEPLWVTVPLFSALTVATSFPFIIIYENPGVLSYERKKR